MDDRWATDADLAYERKDGFWNGLILGWIAGALFVGLFVLAVAA
jgi:hypothetical protein